MAISRRALVLGVVALLTMVSVYTLCFSYTSAALSTHTLGIIGTLLMLQTEITYTLRKKKILTFGSLRKWLQFHIVTGLLGHALILWHANWSFPGLVTYITILVTASGLFGYYIYRSIPPSG